MTMTPTERTFSVEQGLPLAVDTACACVLLPHCFVHVPHPVD